MKFDKEKFESLSDEKKMSLIALELSLETHNATTRADLIMLLDWLYRKVKLDEKTIKQAIYHCYMAEHFEYPGMEEGLCVGLRTDDGEPCETCKECRLQYQYNETHEPNIFRGRPEWCPIIVAKDVPLAEARCYLDMPCRFQTPI